MPYPRGNGSGKTTEILKDIRDQDIIPKSQIQINPDPNQRLSVKDQDVNLMVAPDPTINPQDEIIGDGPDRSILRHYGRSTKLIRLIRKIIRFIKDRWFTEPTKEQLAEMALKRQRKDEQRILRREKGDLLKLFQNEFENHGLFYQRKNGSKKRVRFLVIKSSMEAHYLVVDTKHRPQGVFNSHLSDEALLTDLCIDVGHPVSVKVGEDVGVVYRVDRGGNRAGVPEHCMFRDALDRLPPSADGLSLIFGLGQNARLIHSSLASMPHLIIGGKSGRGKSNLVKCIIATLVMRNDPAHLSMMLIDVKRTDLKVFGGLPHLMNIEGVTDPIDIGVVKAKESVLPALRLIQAEMNKRFEMIDKANDRHISNISDWNQKHRGNKLKRIVVVFDEIGAMREEKGIGDEIEGVLTNLVEMGRSAGIHLVMSTQTLDTKVIPTKIKQNCARVAFFCPNVQASMAVLGDGSATRIIDKPGRAIVDIMAPIELQTPLMNQDIITEVVESVLKGSTVKIQAKHDVTPDEVFMWALANRGGRLTVTGDDGLFIQFRKRGITRDELVDWFTELEGQEVQVNDVLYRVEPGSGQLPRRLVAVDQKEETEEKV